MERKLFIFLTIPLVFAVLFLPFLSFAEDDDTQEEIFEAKVLEVLDEKEITKEDGPKSILQKLKLEGKEGQWKDKEFIFDGTAIEVTAKNLYKKGDRVLVAYSKDIEGKDSFYVTDFVRKDMLYFLAAFFVLIILLTSKWRGARAILGLAFSFVIILYIIIPQILQGRDPLLTSLLYALLIIVISTYLVYGLNRKSTVAITGTFLGLAVVGIFSIIFTKLTHLAGFAQEETIYLFGLTQGKLNLQGLLLAGFVIGALGVLDDITISQVSTIEELKKANPNLSKWEIHKRAMRVGKDHIASMVNTLFLAY